MNAYDFINRLDAARDARRMSEDTTPVAPAPSHAPTSGEDKTTKGQGKSEDEGEPIKKAMKEAVRRLVAGDASAINAILSEKGHKAGCKCGFCANKGKFGKKEGTCKPEDGEQPEKAMQEGGIGGRGCHVPRGKARMGFRHPIGAPRAGAPRPKATINPLQPAMEQLDAASNFDAAIQEMADRLLEDP